MLKKKQNLFKCISIYLVLISFFISFQQNPEIYASGKHLNPSDAQPNPPNRSPVAIINAPSVYSFKNNLQINASSSYDPDAPADSIVEYFWDLNNDNITDYSVPNLELIPSQLTALGWKLGIEARINLTIKDTSQNIGFDELYITLREFEPIAKFSPIPDVAYCGEIVYLDAADSSSSNPTESIVLYEWDLDDDGIFEYTTSEPFAEFSQPLIGNYLVHLRVTDSENFKATTTRTVIVDLVNSNPFANFTAPKILYVGEDLTVDASASWDPDTSCGDAITTFSWNLDGDGIYDDASGKNPTIPWSSLVPLGWNVPGSAKSINLQVEDTKGLFGIAYKVVSIKNREVLADFTITPPQCLASEVIVLNASISKHTDPSRTLVSFQWDLNNDGVFGDKTGVSITHSWGSVGLYPVSVNITDDHGLWAVKQKTVNITAENRAPVAKISLNNNHAHVAGDPLWLNAEESWDPDSGTGDIITAWSWELSNAFSQEFSSVSTAEIPIIPWATLQALNWAPEFTVYARLKVTDNHGLVSFEYASEEIKVVSKTPYAKAQVKARAMPNEVIQFDGSQSRTDRLGASIVQYRWDFNRDGSWESTLSTPFATFSWNEFQMGTRYYRLEVMDNYGQSDTFDGQVSIESILNDPYAAINGSSYLIENNPLILSSSRSQEPDSDVNDYIQSYQWDLNDDSVWDVSGASLNIAWATLTGTYGWTIGNTYNVSLRVTDDLEGRTNITKKQIKAVQNLILPVIRYSPDSNFNLEPIVFNARSSKSTLPDNPITKYEWDIDDDGVFEYSGDSPLFFWTYEANGTYDVKLNITTEAGISVHTIVPITIDFLNHAPVAIISGPGEIKAGETIVLSGAQSSDPDEPCGDSIEVYQWYINEHPITLSGNEKDFELNKEHLSGNGAVPGEVTISLEVIDSHGVKAVDLKTITYIDEEKPSEDVEDNKIWGFPISLIVIISGFSIIVLKSFRNFKKGN